jgi:hypothetical protein
MQSAKSSPKLPVLDGTGGVQPGVGPGIWQHTPTGSVGDGVAVTVGVVVGTGSHWPVVWLQNTSSSGGQSKSRRPPCARQIATKLESKIAKHERGGSIDEKSQQLGEQHAQPGHPLLSTVQDAPNSQAGVGAHEGVAVAVGVIRCTVAVDVRVGTGVAVIVATPCALSSPQPMPSPPNKSTPITKALLQRMSVLAERSGPGAVTLMTHNPASCRKWRRAVRLPAWARSRRCEHLPTCLGTRNSSWRSAVVSASLGTP